MLVDSSQEEVRIIWQLWKQLRLEFPRNGGNPVKCIWKRRIRKLIKRFIPADGDTGTNMMLCSNLVRNVFTKLYA